MKQKSTTNFYLKKKLKIGIYKFNEMAILRADTKTQMDTLSVAVNNAIYTPNEARSIIDLPWQEGGDQLVCNGNYIPITQVGNQYMKGGENNE